MVPFSSDMALFSCYCSLPAPTVLMSEVRRNGRHGIDMYKPVREDLRNSWVIRSRWNGMRTHLVNRSGIKNLRGKSQFGAALTSAYFALDFGY